MNEHYKDSGISPLAAGLGAFGIASMTSGGGNDVTICKSEDDSFYCRFVHDFNIFKMVLFILLVLVILYFIIKWVWFSKKTGRSGKGK